MAELLTRDEAKKLIDRVLARSKADGCQVSINSGIDGNTRFAANEITTSGDSSNAVLTVSSRFGKRAASSQTNLFDDAGIARAVDNSERLAKLSPENPELMPLLGPQTYATVAAAFPATERLDAVARADAARMGTDASVKAGTVTAGFLQRGVNAEAVGNSAGLFAYHRSSQCSYTQTVRTADGTGSGWAGTAHNDWSRVTPPAAVAERAVRKALQSRDPVALEPGRYTVVLEPTAVGNLLGLMAFAMNARAADEGRSFFAKTGGGTKIGEKVVDERVTIFSDPQDPDLLADPYTGEGLPVGRTVWVENGVVKNLGYDRFWADKKGVKPTPFGGGIKMLGGTASLDELIAGVTRGLLVTRFWYIRGVDPRSILNTGLTRDGLFLIENGKVTKSVRNFRFNESPVIMLNNVEALGRPERVVGGEGGGGGGAMVVPPIVAREFTFTSISEAV